MAAQSEILNKLNQGDYKKLTFEKLCLENNKLKYKVFDVLKFLFNEIEQIFKNSKSDKVDTINRLIHGIIIVYNHCLDNGFLVNENLVSKFSGLSEQYKEFVNKLNHQPDEEILNCLIDLTKKVNEYICCEMKLDGEINKLNSLITELNKSLKSMCTEMKLKVREYIRVNIKILKEAENPSEIVLNNFSELLNSYKEQFHSIEVQIATLRETLSNLKRPMRDLEDNFSDLVEKKFTGLTKTYANFQEDVSQTINKELSYCIFNKVDDSEIEKDIIGKLFESTMSFEEIMKYLKDTGYTISNPDLRGILTNIKRRINIIRADGVDFPEKYKICAPKFETYSQMNLAVEGHSMDILFVSDMHISSIGMETLKDLEKLYDYATVNGIKLIVNLGDFVFFPTYHINRGNVYSDYSSCKKLIEDVIKFFPYDENIFQAIMGGNHDQDIMSLGIDPIKNICGQRDDFINLGYNHVTLNFGEGVDVSKIMIHHPKSRVPDAMQKSEYDVNELKKMIKSFYDDKDLKKENYYMDFLGHFHKTTLDMMNGYCVVPSYFKDRFKNGAYHVRIYFDKNNKINYMVFLPLVLEDKLVVTNELVFKKVNRER